jgi:hypothetical protein
MAECRALASEYRRFDTRALNVTGLPVVVSYRCVAAEPGTEERRHLIAVLTSPNRRPWWRRRFRLAEVGAGPE